MEKVKLASEVPAHEASQGPAARLVVRSSSAPSQLELTTLVLVSFALFVTVIALTRNYAATMDNFGDSMSYMNLSSAIRRWNFQGIFIKHFWGLPYAMALLSKLTGVSDQTSLLVCSAAPSLAATLLAWRLWNGWVAGYFAILNFDWLQRSCLGGSEPLFVCLVLGAFAAVRRERWLLGALLAALATVVRPLGLFALLGIGLTLLWKRDFRRCAAATAIGVLVGVLYALPLLTYFGDPLATVNSYLGQKAGDRWLFGFPFYAIITGLVYPAPWTNLALSLGWILLVVTAVVVMARSEEFRAFCRAHPVEMLFLIPYLWCLFTYNYPHWARSNFARFAIPILPFVLQALYRWIPKDRRVLWALGMISAVLAASSALGIVNVVHMLRAALG